MWAKPPGSQRLCSLEEGRKLLRALWLSKGFWKKIFQEESAHTTCGRDQEPVSCTVTSKTAEPRDRSGFLCSPERSAALHQLLGHEAPGHAGEGTGSAFVGHTPNCRPFPQGCPGEELTLPSARMCMGRHLPSCGVRAPFPFHSSSADRAGF